jgi:HAD superfamily hydrolase (TIGR01509 family)
MTRSKKVFLTQKAIIFDHDGVMVNTEPLHSRAWIEILEKYGVRPKLHENGLVHQVGITINENWEILKSNHNLSEDTELLEEQRGQLYLDQLKRSKPMPGMEALLRFLRGEKQKGNLKIAIGSSSNREYIEIALQNFGFSDDFDLIVSGKDVPRGKPAPDIYLKVSRELEVSTENCLVLEDTPAGVTAAKSAGMKVIAIPNAYTAGSDFSNADMMVGSLRAIDPELIYSILKT